MVVPSHLKSLQALELSVRTGSFAAAAEILGITPAAVGQRVKVLEDYLEIPLLYRGRSGIVATPELLATIPHLAAGFAALEAAAQALDLQRAHELHIAALPDFADLWLKPRLDAFRAGHPGIRFCINGEGDAPLRLARVDCEIGFGLAAGDDHCDPLFHDLVLPIASPVNFARTGALAPADRLEGFPLLHLDFYRDDRPEASWPAWFAANAVQRSGPERGMRFRRMSGVLDAVLADAGVALCGVALLERHIDAGSIVFAFPEKSAVQTRGAFHARYRSGFLTNRTLVAFRSWLAREAARTSDWLRARFQLKGSDA